MTFAEIVAEAMQDSFNTARYTDRVGRWVNDAQGKFARKVDVPAFLTVHNFTAAVDARAEAAPVDFLRAVALSIYGPLLTDEASALRRVDGRDFPIDRLDDPPRTTGVPDRYQMVAASVYWYPACDRPYRMALNYRRGPAALVEPADVPEIPADYHELLVTYARAKAFRAEDDREQHDAHMGDWAAGLAEARADLQFADEEGPRIVPGMWG